jgi:hypothetical protein
MKNSMLISAATIILCFGFQVALSAQKTATWKGGTPGRVSDWNCATNWEEGRVPDEFSSVFIPDVSTSTFNYPIIKNEVVEIASLQCAPAAKLTLLNHAEIIVLDTPSEKNDSRSDTLANIPTPTVF